MKVTAKRVLTALMLVGGLVTGYQLLSTPPPVATPQNAEEARANAQSFDQKIRLIETAREEGGTAEARFSSDEVSAEVSQSMGAGLNSPDAVVGQGEVRVKGYQVKLDGDVARGQFATNIGR